MGQSLNFITVLRSFQEIYFRVSFLTFLHLPDTSLPFHIKFSPFTQHA